MDKGLKTIMLIVALLVVGLGGFAAGASVDVDGTLPLLGSGRDDFEVVEEAYDKILTESADPPSEEELTRAAVKAMLEVVKEGDDYALYYNPKEYRDFLDYSTGSFSGIGVNLNQDGETLEILSVIPATPAAAEGLKRGDVIYAVDGEPVARMSIEEAVSMVKGAPGTEVTVTVVRDGEKIDFDITRAEIAFPNLRGRITKNDVGYIQLYGFAKGAGQQLERKVENLKEQGARGIVLDLRDNGGGLLSEAISVASVFIEEGEIVTYRGSSGEIVYEAEGDAFEDIPLVVLVNGGTASASEIVANALQDQGRGKLVGSQTFGKGSVQDIIGLSDLSAVKLTTGTYLSPDGENIDGEGIEPDVVIEDNKRNAQKRKAFAVLEQVAASQAQS
ncbi:MAG: S41 family peptidase [Actinomycetota bacterium]|nr:S41 family peptidase [Actinomycetota bacterium]